MSISPRLDTPAGRPGRAVLAAACAAACAAAFAATSVATPAAAQTPSPPSPAGASMTSPADPNGARMAAGTPALREPVAEMFTDAKIAATASVSNVSEIQPSQLALQKSQSADVRQFAQRMVDEHTRLEQGM